MNNLRSRSLLQYLLPLVALLLSATAQAADFELHPNLTVNEEYTDNIAEDKDKSLGHEFITRAMPGFTLHYAAPFWVWDGNYKYEFRYYDLNKRNSEHLLNLATRSRLTLIDEKVFLDLSDEYQRVSLDQARDTTQESLFANQSDQNIFTVSPNLVLRPTSKLILRPGVAYQNIWYKDPSGVGRDIYSAYLNSEYEMTDKFSLISSYAFNLTDAQGSTSKTHNLMAGIKLEYFKDSFISIQGGYSWFINSQQTSNYPVWSVAINYAGDRYNIKAGTGQAYTNDPTTNKLTLNTNYNIGIDCMFNKGTLGFVSSIVDIDNIPGNVNFSTSYNNSASLKYELIKDWEFNISYGFNYVDITHSDTYTTISLLNTGVTYSYSNDTKISLRYRNLHMYSPVLMVDNKDINNILIEMSKTF